MKIYQEVIALKTAFTKWSISKDHNREVVEAEHAKMSAKVAALQGSGTFTLTKEQATMCQLIEKRRNELRPQLVASIFVEDGKGLLYVTDAHVLLRIPVEVETTQASFWGNVSTFVAGKNQITPRPEDQVVCPADFECVIPAHTDEHALFTCKEIDLVDLTKGIGHLFHQNVIEVRFEELRIAGLGVKDRYEDICPEVRCTIKAHGSKDGYTFGVAPDVFQVILSGQDKNRRVTFRQEVPTRAITIDKGDGTLYLLMPIML